MRPGPQRVTRFFQPYGGILLLGLLTGLLLWLLLGVLPSTAAAQAKKPPAPAPAPAPKPAPKPAAKPAPEAKPAPKPEPEPKPAAKPADHPTSGGGNTGGNSKTTGGGNTGGAHSNTANNKTTGGGPGANRTNNNSNNRGNMTPPAPKGPAPNVETVRTVGPNGGNSKSTGNGSAGAGKNAGMGRGNSSTGGKAGGAGLAGKGANSSHVNNTPGTHPMPNGGSRTVHSNGSAVEKNKSGKITGISTSKGNSARLDSHGHAAAIHDGKGTSISRGPHGERKIQTVRGDGSRLVSSGRHSGFAEKRFTRDGHEYARRSYYDHGHMYARVYEPHYYMGYPFFWYVPPFYYGPAYYGWVYGAWATPVAYTWGWYGSPWYAPYGYYFAPYPVYPAPAFWLADYAIAASLQAAAEESQSGSFRSEAGFVLASAGRDGQDQGAAGAAMSKELKDKIAKQVKIIIADEKAAAAAHGNLPSDDDQAERVPPSLDPRFTLLIAPDAITLDTDDGACALTAGDVVQRTEDAADADATVAVAVVSSKNGDCAVGTASRMAVDDLEDMHDSFRQKIDDGMKSLAENQGKSGIPSAPPVATHPVSEGQAAPDQTVEADLKKQQEAADAMEKDVEGSSAAESGSTD
jgi:hypothetical protein